MESPQEPRNPFEPPKAEIETQADGLEYLEADRQAHIAREKSLRTLGWLNLIGSGMSIIIGFAFILLGEPEGVDMGAWDFVVGLMAGILGLWVGWALLKLRKEAQIGIVIQFVIALPGLFEIGGIGVWALLLNVLFLYLVFSSRGKRVLKPDYKEVIRQTPHVRYRTPFWLWAILFVLLAFLAIMLLPVFLR